MPTAIVVTIHGVNSENDGMQRLGEYLCQEIPSIEHVPIFTKTIKPFEALSKNQRALLIQTVRAELQNIAYKTQIELHQGKYSEPPHLFVVCHSFGTLKFVESLKNGLEYFTAHEVILLGSIIRRQQRWNGFVDRGLMSKRPWNIVRPFDGIVFLGRKIGGGLSGTRGFIMTDASAPRNTFKHGGHTEYDPHDFDDIRKIIVNGSIEPTNFHQFRASLTWWEKIRLWTIRRTGRG